MYIVVRITNKTYVYAVSVFVDKRR